MQVQHTVGQLSYEGHHLLELMVFLSLTLQRKIIQGFASDQWCLILMLQILIAINFEVHKAGKKHLIYTGSYAFADLKTTNMISI